MVYGNKLMKSNVIQLFNSYQIEVKVFELKHNILKNKSTVDR